MDEWTDAWMDGCGTHAKATATVSTVNRDNLIREALEKEVRRRWPCRSSSARWCMHVRMRVGANASLCVPYGGIVFGVCACVSARVGACRWCRGLCACVRARVYAGVHHSTTHSHTHLATHQRSRLLSHSLPQSYLLSHSPGAAKGGEAQES
jgi:hypothetical protein